MGPMTRNEVILLLTFLLVAGLWIVSGWLGLNYTVVALLGMVILFLTGVLRWEDALGERMAWDVFIWYGGLVKLAGALTDFGLTQRFAETASAYTAGWHWALAFALLLVVYFFAHYGFASITAHATAMFIPFTTLVIAGGAPPMLTVIAFACFSNLCASLTHYGTTPAPIWFGAGYVSQGTWWRLGLMSGLTTAAIWATVGVGWWVVLGCSVALDDFGTGYSSLGYLPKLRFSTIKVDRSFVQGAANHHPESLAIIRAVVAMADSLEMSTTAEGVETAEEAEMIRQFGCKKIQGYYFGRPMPSEEARKVCNRATAPAEKAQPASRGNERGLYNSGE